MQTKFIIFIIIITVITANLANAQPASSENENIDKMINTAPLSKQLRAFKNTSYGAKAGDYLTKITDWLHNRKEAIKVGWQEEKEEFKGEFKKIVSDAWQKKIKNLAELATSYIRVFLKRGD